MIPGDPTRASDGERDAVVQQLQEAHAEGRLDDSELADRMGAALGALTRGDLAQLLNDLPSTPGEAAIVPVPQPALPAKAEQRSMAPAWVAWGTASAVTFVVWLITSVGAGTTLYPWFLWVAGPWGAVLAVKTIGNRFIDGD